MESIAGKHFDVVIIGAGMSALAAGIRLALFDKNVIILERHNVSGGLNSFYSFNGRKYDVGLHALTNFVRPEIKGTPFTKLLRQLRISRDQLALSEQKSSRIAIPGMDLRFSNDPSYLESEIDRLFPHQIDAFRQLVKYVESFDDVNLGNKEESARLIVRQYIQDPVLEDMLFLPLMYYGSAQENDMDWSQFAIMFKSIFREGFARPYEGVRRIIKVLLDQYRRLGGMRKMKCGVKAIYTQENRAQFIELDNGDPITANTILSSIGLQETLHLLREDNLKSARSYSSQNIDLDNLDGFKEIGHPHAKNLNLKDHSNRIPYLSKHNIGQLSFVETMTFFNAEPSTMGWNETIVFYNDRERFTYQKPDSLVDTHSGVICIPNNYHYENGKTLEEGCLRVTALANYDRWRQLGSEIYAKEKQFWFEKINQKALEFLPKVESNAFRAKRIATDMFTPLTVERYTGHLSGSIYGAPHKVKDGRTHLDNVFICGTDQGFVGIIGALLSGVSMANLHILSKS